MLVVEGEKAQQAAAGALSAYRAVTWAGGANAVKTADWGALAGRDVILWPDADEPGRTAMAWLASQLLPTAKRVRVVDTEGQPAGWDLADAIAEGWTQTQVAEWARPRAREVAKPAQVVAVHTERPHAGAPPIEHEADCGSAVVSWQTMGLQCSVAGSRTPTKRMFSLCFEAIQALPAKSTMTAFDKRSTTPLTVNRKPGRTTTLGGYCCGCRPICG